MQCITPAISLKMPLVKRYISLTISIFDRKIIMKSNAIEFFQILLAPSEISANWLSASCKTKDVTHVIFGMIYYFSFKHLRHLLWQFKKVITPLKNLLKLNFKEVLSPYCGMPLNFLRTSATMHIVAGKLCTFYRISFTGFYIHCYSRHIPLLYIGITRLYKVVFEKKIHFIKHWKFRKYIQGNLK